MLTATCETPLVQKKDGQLPFGLDCVGIRAALAVNDATGTVGGWILDPLGLDGAVSTSFSVKGLFGVPLSKDLTGKGLSVDVGVTASFDFRDPLNLAVTVQDSVAVLDTVGAGGFVTLGPSFGASRMPESGFSESLYATARGAAGFGLAISGDVDLFGDPQTGDMTGGAGSFGGGAGKGFGALSGVSDTTPGMVVPSYSYSSGSLNGRATLEAYYEEHCE